MRLQYLSRQPDLGNEIFFPGRVLWMRLVAMLLFLIVLADGNITSDAADGKDSQLVVVTSFPESFYTTLRDEFQAKYPQMRVKVLNKKTTAAISYIQRTTSQPADLFWASSPDAFEVLKEGGYLQIYRPTAVAIPMKIRNYPIHDPDGYYTGFAISGYGIMWNRRYLEKNNLPAPANWVDLTSVRYFRHIGMSTPSRSGTTHIAVETILQSQGWEAGWKILFEMAGNLATITARSFGVPDGVNSGRFGIGIVIDFFGLSSNASGYPVTFTYPKGTALLPANIAVINGARNVAAAAKFIDYLLSDQGQRLLFKPHIRRLPVMPSVYADAPSDYPNPFESKTIHSIVFDSDLSKHRYHLVNSLFDQMITYRHKALQRTWQAIHTAEAKMRLHEKPKVKGLIDKARQLATQVPVSRQMAENVVFTSLFVRKQKGKPLPDRQAELESQWDTISRHNLEAAQDLAAEAIAIME